MRYGAVGYNKSVATRRRCLALKIVINESPLQAETEIIIHCRETDAEVLRLLTLLKSTGSKLCGMREGQTHLLESADLLYCDTVDKRCFLYTKAGVYETPLRLYEIEERLAGEEFFRSSKSSIININKIRSLCPTLGGRLELTLQSGERLVVSRQYAAVLKQKLGLR